LALRAIEGREEKKSSFCEQKETKKLCHLRERDQCVRDPPSGTVRRIAGVLASMRLRAKVFLVLFVHKKNKNLLSLRSIAPT
jgi:hypothetical protein